MQIDQNHFHVHTLELSNPKVLIRPHQAESTKGKNVVVAKERHEKRVLQRKTSQVAIEALTLGGQDKEKEADNKSTGLTGHSGGLTGMPSKSGNSSKSKTRPSFKELLAKYEKEGTAQKRRSSKVKDMKSSTKHQEQSDSHPRQVDTPSNEPVTPWYGRFPYSYLPMVYNRIYM